MEILYYNVGFSQEANLSENDKVLTPLNSFNVNLVIRFATDKQLGEVEILEMMKQQITNHIATLKGIKS